MINTVATAKTKGVMELSLGAGEESSALGHHLWGEGELLAVENEHVAVLDEIFLAISALAKGQVDQTQHIIELGLAEADVMFWQYYMMSSMSQLFICCATELFKGVDGSKIELHRRRRKFYAS